MAKYYVIPSLYNEGVHEFLCDSRLFAARLHQSGRSALALVDARHAEQAASIADRVQACEDIYRADALSFNR